MSGNNQFPLELCGPGCGAEIKTNIYDIEEIHHNCTVQVLRNSVTGEVSIGWWPEGKFPEIEGSEQT